MAKGFFNKLNTLVQAHINDIVSPMSEDDERTSRARRSALSRQEIRGGLEKDVGTLRERIDDALAYQDQLQSKADKLYAEISDYDAKADEAVAAGREEEAKRHIRRMQQAQRELEITEANLSEHRFLTQDLISQVNTLEGVVDQARGRDTDAPADAPANTQVEEFGRNIAAKLDQTREKLNQLIEEYRPPRDDAAPRRDDAPEPRMYSREEVVDEAPQPEPRRTNHPVRDDDVDDDFASRLSRLSKPESDDE